MAFFNFAKNNLDKNITNPCDSPMLRKLFRPKVKTHWDILEKDTVDKIIFRTTKIRDRFILETMAPGAGFSRGIMLMRLIAWSPIKENTAKDRSITPGMLSAGENGIRLTVRHNSGHMKIPLSVRIVRQAAP